MNKIILNTEEARRSDVWELETSEEQEACNTINYLYERATKYRQVYPRNVLKRLYGDSWETIKERMKTEGSVWYVWYMDGVRNLINKNY
jgi:hypothetical protein